MKVVEKIKTHIFYSVCFRENRAVYEIMSKHVVVLERPHMAMRREMHTATGAQAHAQTPALTKRNM